MRLSDYDWNKNKNWDWIDSDWIESNWAELKCLNKFICLFMIVYSWADWYIHTFIHTFIHIYNVIEVLYPRENNFALEPIYIYIGDFASALYPNRVRKMEK